MIQVELKKSLLITVFFCALAIGSASFAEDLLETSKKNCKIFQPQYAPSSEGDGDGFSDWKDKKLTWNGNCKNGKAHGIGVLRGFKKDERPVLFLGKLNLGRLDLGVVDNGYGYEAGPYMKDFWYPKDENGHYPGEKEAYQFGIQAAAAFSQSLAKIGNHASAKFYSDKAKQFQRDLQRP